MQIKTEVEKQLSLGYKIREFENSLLDLFSRGILGGTTHTCIGQEVTALIFASLANDEDVFVSNHRCHGHYLALTEDFLGLFYEIIGDARGVSGGVGGSQHLCIEGRFYSNGIQGGILGLAAGTAYYNKKNSINSNVYCFIGDGTMGEGLVYEVLNLSKLLQLNNLIIVLENNHIAQSTRTEDVSFGEFSLRFKSFGLPVLDVDDTDYLKSKKTISDFIHVNNNNGPKAIIVNSVRLGAHSKGDDTRDDSEIQRLKLLDPIIQMEKSLPYEITEQLRKDAKEAIKSIIDDALNTTRTYNSTNLLKTDEDCNPCFEEREFVNFEIDLFRNQINRTIDGFLTNYNGVFFGEDIRDPYGGAFKVSVGLTKKHDDKIVNMPISEAGFVAIASGYAINNAPILVEIMFGDFFTLAFDQLYNHATKYGYMYGKKINCPIYIRLPVGAGRGYGPTHSQSVEGIAVSIPNMRVIYCCPLVPTAQIYNWCFSLRSPTIFLENKIDYGRSLNKLNCIKNYKNIVGNGYVFYQTKEDVDLEDKILIITYGGSSYPAVEMSEELFFEHEIIADYFIFYDLSLDSIADNIAEFASKYKRLILTSEDIKGRFFQGYFFKLFKKYPLIFSKISLAFPGVPIVPAARDLEDTHFDTKSLLRRLIV